MIPVVVQDLVDKMNNPKEQMSIRDNYCATLENIKNQLDIEIKKFQKERTRFVYDMKKKR